MIILVDNTEVKIRDISYQPGEGLVWRLEEDISVPIFASLGVVLVTVLRASPCKIFRPCCDTAPEGDHADDCENAAKKDKAK